MLGLAWWDEAAGCGVAARGREPRSTSPRRYGTPGAIFARVDGPARTAAGRPGVRVREAPPRPDPPSAPRGAALGKTGVVESGSHHGAPCHAAFARTSPRLDSERAEGSRGPRRASRSSTASRGPQQPRQGLHALPEKNARRAPRRPRHAKQLSECLKDMTATMPGVIFFLLLLKNGLRDFP